MAHPRRFAALDRKALTVGLTAAMLAVPMAGTSLALDVEQELSATEIATAEALGLELEGLTSEELEAAVAAAEAEPAQTVESTTDAVTEAAPDPVADAVQQAAETAPAPVAEVVAPEGEAPKAPGGGSAETAGDDGYQTVTPPPPRQASAPAPQAPAPGPATVNTAPALDVRNDLRATGSSTTAFRSSSEQPTLQPSAPAPLVSTPFVVQAPQVGGEAVQTPLTALAAAPNVVADAYEAITSTSTPLSAHPTGVPGALTATAASLLLMVGAGHVLHRNGTLRRTYAG